MNDILATLGNDQIVIREPSEERLKSDRNTGFSGFITMMYRLLKSVMPEINFRPAWPQGSTPEAKFPAITYKTISKNPTPGRGIKPRLMEVLPDEEHPGHEVLIYIQDFDVIIEFDLWTERSYEADGLGCNRDPSTCQLASQALSLCNTNFKPELCPYCIDGILERFENFMIDYAGVFMRDCGIQQMYFMEQLEDEQVESINPPAIKRPLQYFIRFERIHVCRTAELETIDISIDPLEKEE